MLTKDADFARLLAAQGPPPRVLWLTVGNTSNANTRTVLASTLQPALALFEAGDAMVEIAARP